MTDREIMQTALVTLKNCLPVNYCYNNFGEASPMYKKDGLSVEKINESIKSLEAALAQPEQEQLAKDQVTHGMSVTIDGKRIDPSSIYEMIKEKNT